MPNRPPLLKIILANPVIMINSYRQGIFLQIEDYTLPGIKRVVFPTKLLLSLPSKTSTVRIGRQD